MRGLILIGGGEHARSVAWAAESHASGWLRGLIDPGAAAQTVAACGIPRLGDDTLIPKLASDHDFVLGVGALRVSSVRGAVVARALAAGARFAAVVHRQAIVAPSATIEGGAVVMAGAIIGPGARICAHAVVNTGAIVEHDCEIGPLAQIAPGAVLGGAARVGAEAFVGLGARVRDHVIVGDRAMVAMGAVLVTDLAADRVAFGVPARLRGGGTHA